MALIKIEIEDMPNNMIKVEFNPTAKEILLACKSGNSTAAQGVAMEVIKIVMEKFGQKKPNRRGIIKPGLIT